MNENSLSGNPSNNEIIFSIKSLIKFFWDGKWKIFFWTFVASIVIVIYSLSIPNVYTSKAILAPSNQANQMNQALGSYSAITAIANIQIPSSSKNVIEESIQIIKSLRFFEEQILPNIFLPDLMALDYWDAANNKLSYQQNLYDADQDKWVREVIFPQSVIPSSQESHKKFLENHISLSKNPKNGFISITLKHQSPHIAKKWLESIIFLINEKIRSEEKNKSILAIEFLNKQISSTNFTEIKQVLSSLLQRETENLMLIEADSNYVFKTLDFPVAPEQKSDPNRALICILGAIFGFFLGLLNVIVMNLINRIRKLE